MARGHSKYGIKLSDLTLEVYQAFLKIYDETVGSNSFNNSRPDDAEYTAKMINDQGFCERRHGSCLSSHSKLCIKSLKLLDNGEKPDWEIYFSFSGNLTKDDPQNIREPVLVKQFAQKVDKFLEDKGLAIEI